MCQQLLTSILFACVLHAAANTYHVSTAGNNANSGFSLGTAWATLQYAADHISAGDTVLVENGSYTGFNLMDNNATAMDPTVFLANGDNVQVMVPCSYNNLDGINLENVAYVEARGFIVNGMPRTGIRTALSDHVTLAWNSCGNNGEWGILTGFAEHILIEHNTCYGSIGQHGIYFSNSADNPVIRYNECYDNYDNGIHMNGDIDQGGDGIISNAQVYGNVIHNNGTGGGSGINCDGVINSVFYNNVLYGNHASGISLYQIDGAAPSTGDQVYNNVIINAADSRWCVNITTGCTGNQVLNNVLINEHPWHGSISCDATALTGFVSDHNIIVNSFTTDDGNSVLTLAQWQVLGHDTHSLIANAQNTLFVDPASGDFHTLNAQSQQVDAGTSAVLPVVIDDIEGQPRPQGNGYDIGCYESDFSTGMWAVDALAGGALLVQTSDGLHVINAPGGSALSVFDVTGQVTFRQVINVNDALIAQQLDERSIAVLRSHDGALLRALKLMPLR